MRHFLSARPVGDHEFEITVGSTTDAVIQGGLVSPVFPAFGGELPEVSDATGLLLCFPASSHALLTKIQNQKPREVRSRTMISYGLASVLIFGDVGDLRTIADEEREALNAYELWPLRGGRLKDLNVERYIREGVAQPPPPISADRLPYDAGCQVRQLNASIAFAVQRAAIYAPELVDALGLIASAAAQLVDVLRTDDGRLRSVDDVRQHHYYLARVLEISAGLAMVISQTFSGGAPLLRSDYPVGEYGLLGIGSASRALWSFYHHLRACFLGANHGARLFESAGDTVPFEPFVDWRELDFGAWESAKGTLTKLPPASGTAPAPHLLHFSSRFGFHETEYTLGASWQSLHASSSREWHLLTVTHEYIHSQVRQITSAVYPADTNWERLSELFRGEKPENAMESYQVAMAQAMARYESARSASESVEAGTTHLDRRGFNERPSADQVRSTVANELRYFQEVVVHVLDFLYTFHGDPRSYLTAIWQSWSTVPSVTERIHDYLLRSLCALASDSTMTKRDTREVFEVVVESALHELRELTIKFESPVVGQAIAYLESEVGEKRLYLEFAQTYYIARFARTFLYDPLVATALRRDDLTILAEPDARRYVFDPGEYPDGKLQSPLAFLSDRFKNETMEAGPELEFASLWQLLLLTDPERKAW